MKRTIISKLIVLLVALMAGGAVASAYDFEEGGILYTVNSDGTTLTVNRNTESSYSGDVVIPDEVTHDGTTYAVTAIADRAFYQCSGLTGIVIGDNVTSVGMAAFQSCTNLTSVTIGLSVPSLRYKKGATIFNAFSSSSKITSLTWKARNCADLGGMTTANFQQVTLGEEVEVIPDNFAKGSQIVEVSIPNSVTTIGNSAFEGCQSLTCANIPTSVTTIGYSAFSGCRSMTGELILPSSVTTIGNSAFSGCSGLTGELVIPNTVISIGSSVFAGCSGLTGDLMIPNSVLSIGNEAFSGCSSLSSATIGNSVTSIGNSAFQNCSLLESIVIPNSVTTIGSSAFQECEHLESVVMGNSVESIGEYAFYLCWELTKVFISDLEAWCNISFQNLANPMMYGAQLFLNGEEITVFVIPNTITRIGDYMFQNFINLTAVVIPSSVTSIGEGAFSGCEGLTEINIPNSVTSIGDYAFNGCIGLTSIVIPNSVTSIGERAFEWCSSIESIIVEDGNPVYDSRDNCNAIIKTESNVLMSGCKNTVIPTSVNTIGEAAFCGSGLTSIAIPNSITTIGNEAFWSCADLTNVDISSSVTTIGNGAFSCCESLTDINIATGNPVYDSRDNCNAIIETASNTLIFGCKNTVIPNTVTTIGNNAFDRCFTLTSISIPNSVVTIGDEAFFLCYGLTDVDFGNGVTTIGAYAFAVCESLENINIPNSVTSIGQYAFWLCNGLKSATIPNSVNVTEPYTADLWFVECSGLTKVTIGSGIAYMGGMFYKCPNITSVTCLATTPPRRDAIMNIETNQLVYNFDDVVFNQATLYVPAGSLEEYQTHRDWKDFQDIRPLGDADGDGIVGVADVTELIDYMLSRDGNTIDMGAADADGDGAVTIADVTALLDTILHQ